METQNILFVSTTQTLKLTQNEIYVSVPNSKEIMPYSRQLDVELGSRSRCITLLGPPTSDTAFSVYLYHLACINRIVRTYQHRFHVTLHTSGCVTMLYYVTVYHLTSINRIV